MTASAARPPNPAPLISVIVAVHDVAGHVGPCLQSLAAQSLTDFEALVIDDGSTDDSLAEARAAVAGDARFQLLSFPNGGLGAARNRGLDRAQGAFIAFLDGDDRVTPDWLSRMHQALEADGGDWVATGLRFVGPEGEAGPPHPAMHGPMPDMTAPERHDLGDWCEVIRHYPSAWNKLYRRRLIEGLRFDEGTYYEDHAFFWRASLRTGHLLRLPDALYLQTQGRAGQITRDGSERVFEQFAVLDQLATIQAEAEAAGIDRSGGPEALARIATRLIYERSQTIADRARRGRFAEAARALMHRHGLTWTPDWDPGIRRGFGLVVAGHLPLSVVLVTDGAEAPLAASLDALRAQSLPDFELVALPDDGAAAARTAAALAAGGFDAQVLTGGTQTMAARVAAGRNAGLLAARGEFVLFLDAGDRLQPEALALWLDAMRRHGQAPGGQAGAGADMGVFAFLPGPGAPAHCGLHDRAGLEAALVAGPFAMDGERALRLHPHPSAKLFRRDFLREARLGFAPHLLQSWQFTLEAALRAARVVHLPRPGLVLDQSPGSRRFWTAAPTAADLAAALDRVIAATAAAAGQGGATGGGHALPAGWQRRLFARAIWEKVNFAAFPTPEAAEGFAREMGAELAARGLVGDPETGGALDPYIGPRIRAILQGG